MYMKEPLKKVGIPVNCPLCGDEVRVTQIKCSGCGSEINGSFKRDGLEMLPDEYRKFIVVFLKHRGTIKAVEAELGVSYPTINRMLENINQMLGAVRAAGPQLDRKQILDAIERGEMSVKEATEMLKKSQEP
jgi:hypothetical protein